MEGESSGVVKIGSVVIVSDQTSQSSSLSAPAACYANPAKEKSSRGRLKSEFDRAVNSGGHKPREQRLIIVDSLNYIKGYRYELYCISKAAGERHGVVWAMNSADQVRKWNLQQQNQQREEGQGGCGSSYSDAMLEDLIRRYEPPDARNRWDSPLYTIDLRPPEEAAAVAGGKEGMIVGEETTVAATALLEAAENSVYDMHRLRSALGQQRTETSAIDAKSGLAPSSSVPTMGDETRRFLSYSAMTPMTTTSTTMMLMMSSSTSATGTKVSIPGRGGARKRAVFKRPKNLPKVSDESNKIVMLQQNSSSDVASAASFSSITDAPETTSTINCSYAPSPAAASKEEPEPATGDCTVGGERNDGWSSQTKQSQEAQLQGLCKQQQHQRQQRIIEQQVLDMLRSFLSDKTNRPLKAGTSTIRRDVSDSDLLHWIDSVTQQVCRTILLADDSAAAGTRDVSGTEHTFTFSLYGETFVFSSKGIKGREGIHLSDQLPMLRRQYMHWVATYPPENAVSRNSSSNNNNKSAKVIARSFLEYLDAQAG
jgi:tRNA uridine 5-carbamoylmethylation protein Kti12